MKKIKLLLADDHQVVRNGIKLMLEAQDSFEAIVDEATNGEEVLDKLRKRHEYDIIVLDIHLPKMDGVQVAKKVLNDDPSQKILILSMYTESYIVKKALATGVRGYLLKNTGIEELTSAILTVEEGKKYYTNDITQILMSDDDSESNTNQTLKNPKLQDGILSKRETQVLKLIANEMTSSEISKELCISKRTVDGHRKRIMEKLNVGNVVGLVKFAIQNGMD